MSKANKGEVSSRQIIMKSFSTHFMSKRMKIQQAITLLCALVLCSVGVLAQTTPDKKLSFGVFAGAAVNLHNANFTEFASAPIYSPRTGASNEPANFTATSKAGIVVGGFVEYTLSPKWAIQGRILYADRAGDLTTSENIVIGLNAPVNGSTIVNAQSNYTIAGKLSTLNIEPTLVFAPLDGVGLRVMAGAGLNLLMGKSTTITEALVLPAGVSAGFADAGNGQYTTSRTLFSGDLPGATSMILSINAGVGYDIAVGSITLTPELMASMMAGNFADVSWNAPAIRFGVGARF